MSQPELSPGPGEEGLPPYLSLATGTVLNDFPASRIDSLGSLLEAYDPSAPEAAHLRGHQVDAVQAFRSVSDEILTGRRANEGMAILHPTGGGKTVTAAEIIRMVSGTTRPDLRPVRSLLLVPGHQILDQTTGYGDEVGTLRRFAPEVTVGEYSGRAKETGAQTTVMTYQSLPGAIKNGTIGEINPGLVVCDENHHIIDGRWAQAVKAISSGRLLLGMTATPAYNAERTISRLFPYQLDRLTMRQGIENGVLAPLQGYLYKGAARINVTRGGADFSEEDMYEAIAGSEDNYLAIKICVNEIEQGRRGVISCVPGHDRAHAKIMTEMLKAATVRTEDGVRNIRAAYVGGEMDKDTVRATLQAHRRGDIDVLTSVNLIFEGWDSPETDFIVALRPTTSVVLAEQRIGRGLRPHEDKTATFHELIYAVEGADLQQVTHLDILGEGRVMQGRPFRSNPRPSQASQSRKRFQTEAYRLDPELANRIAELDAVPLEEMRILCRQEAVPIEWQTPIMIARNFGLELDEVTRYLAEAKVHALTEQVGPDVHTFYPPRANRAIADRLGISAPPKDSATLTELLALGREHAPGRHLSRQFAAEALCREGMKVEIYCLDDGTVIRAYPPESRIAIQALAEGGKKKTAEITAYDEQEAELAKVPDEQMPPHEAASWLQYVLVNPDNARTTTERHDIAIAQRHLLAAIRLAADGYGTSSMPRSLIQEQGLAPDVQMMNVMHAKQIDFSTLLSAAAIAKRLHLFNKTKTQKK